MLKKYSMMKNRLQYSIRHCFKRRSGALSTAFNNQGKREVIEMYDSVESRVRSLRKEITGMVRVAAIYSVGLHDMSARANRLTLGVGYRLCRRHGGWLLSRL